MKNHKELLQVAACLNAAVANSRLYSAEHPQVARYLDHAFQALRQALESRAELTFMIVDGEVVVENRTLTSNTPHVRQFAKMLYRCAIERITFTAEVSPAQLKQFAGDLADTEKSIVRSSPGIILGRIQTPQAGSKIAALSVQGKQILKGLGLLDDKPLDEVRELFERVKQQQQRPFEGLKEIVQGFVSGMLYNIQPLDLLASLKSANEYTFTHAINVCILTMAQAEMLGVGSGKLYEVGIAAALHDVGKIFVPLEILNKPGRLNDAEWQVMREHTIRGARYILRMEGLPKLAFIAALEHHIRYDGSGYPHLQEKWKPNIISQMIAVADLFDAMRSRRPYQDPKSDGEIIEILREEAGKTLNPTLVANFLKLVQSHPNRLTSESVID